MIQAMPIIAPSSSVRDRLIGAATDLIARHGPRSVTARSLAELSGQSASAVNYHFGGREGLLAATFEAAVAEVGTWRSGWSLTLQAAPPPEAFPGWFLAITLDRLASRPMFLVLRELRHHAARTPTYRDLARREATEADQFWVDALVRFGLPGDAAGTCSDFTESILGIHGGSPDHPDQNVWLAETTKRFCARVAGNRGPAPGWDGWRKFARTRRGPSPLSEVAAPSAVRIATSAAELLGREGMEALTHRAVAAEVGLSLAAVSGYFPSKTSLVRGAFDRLISTISAVRGEIVPEQEDPQPISHVAGTTAETLFDAKGSAAPWLLAFDEMLTAAIRDPDLRRDAEDLRASRGENSAGLLARVKHGSDPVDGLDAHILSIVTTGAMRSAYAQDLEDRRPWLTARIAIMIEVLFGKAA
jgi:AcrR family transcriptional regulator